ncbi:hypothetical protein P7C70_g8759, partial [Phenoliferia sp. Uapishka_3]
MMCTHKHQTCDDTQGRSVCTGRRRVLDKLREQEESILTSKVSETGLKIPVYSTRSSSPFLSQAGTSHSKEAPASSDEVMTDEQSDARVARWSIKDVGPARKNKSRKLARGRKINDEDTYRPPAPRKARPWKDGKSPGSSSSSARSQGSRKSEGSGQSVKSHRSSGTRELDRPVPTPHLDELLAQAERLHQVEDSIMREREGQDVLQEIFETRTGPWIHTCSPEEAAERAAILREEYDKFLTVLFGRKIPIRRNDSDQGRSKGLQETLAPALPIHAHAPPRNSRECSSMMFSVRVPGDGSKDSLKTEPRENFLKDESRQEQNEDIEVMDAKAPEPEFDFQEWVNDQHAQIYEPEEENDPRAGIQTFCAQNGDIVIEESAFDSGSSDLSEERLISELGLRMAETGLASNFMELAFDDGSSEEEADDDSLSNDFAISGDITYEMLDRYPRLDDPGDEDFEGSSEIYSVSDYEYDIGLRDEFGQLTDGPIFINGEWRTYELEDDSSDEEGFLARYVANQIALETSETQDEPTIEEVPVTEPSEEIETWRTFDLASAPSSLEDQTGQKEILSGLIDTFIDDRISEELEQASRHRVLRQENLGAANPGDVEDLLFGVSSINLLDVDGRASLQFKGEEASLAVAREIRLASTNSFDGHLGENLSELEKDRLVLKELREDLKRTFFEVQASREGKASAPSKDKSLPSTEKLAPPPPHDSTREDLLEEGSQGSTAVASFRNFLREQIELGIIRDMTTEEENDLLARTHQEEGFTDYQIRIDMEGERLRFLRDLRDEISQNVLNSAAEYERLTKEQQQEGGEDFRQGLKRNEWRLIRVQNLMRRAILRMEMEWLTSELDHMLADHTKPEARETQEGEQGSSDEESDYVAHERMVKNHRRRQLILDQIMEVERTLWGKIDTPSKSEDLAEEWASKRKEDVFPESLIPEITTQEMEQRRLEAEAEWGNSVVPTMSTLGLTYDYQRINIQGEDGASNQGMELRAPTMTLSPEGSDEGIIVEAATLRYEGSSQDVLPEKSRQVNLAEVVKEVKNAESELIRLEERIEDAYQRFEARLRNQIDSREPSATNAGSTPRSKSSNETTEDVGDQTRDAPDESENELWHVKPMNAMEYNLRKGMTRREAYREELFMRSRGLGWNNEFGCWDYLGEQENSISGDLSSDDETTRGRGSVRWITPEDWEDELRKKEVGLRVGEMKIPPTSE